MSHLGVLVASRPSLIAHHNSCPPLTAFATPLNVPQGHIASECDQIAWVQLRRVAARLAQRPHRASLERGVRQALDRADAAAHENTEGTMPRVSSPAQGRVCANRVCDASGPFQELPVPPQRFF